MSIERIDYLIENHIHSSGIILDSFKPSSIVDNSRGFELFRVNYFHRTRNTIPSLSRLLISSIESADTQTATLIGKNIYEETGEGDPSKSHIKLLEKCFNEHGTRVFNLPKLQIKDSNDHLLLTHATRSFIISQNQAYSNSNYHVVLAVSYAQETVANPMLKKICEVFFEPYKLHYMNHDYKEVIEYFDCHINGLEERHALDIKESLIRNCQDRKSWKKAYDQVATFLDAQKRLWEKVMELSTKEPTTVL